MEISKINNKEWLARSECDAIEAACFFAQIDVKAHIKVYLHGDTLNHSEAKKYLGVFKTWADRASLFWFINKAIKEGYPEISEVILSAVREYIERLLPNERHKFLQDYPSIAHKLSLAVTNQDDNPPTKPESMDEVKYSWIPYARNVYYELKVNGIKLHESKLSGEQKAVKVEEEMKKRFADGDKNMVKRGGKKVPSSSTILRHALQNL